MTNLIEIEAIVNKRPITSLTDSDPIKALSPFDFLLPYGVNDSTNSLIPPTFSL